MRTDPGGRGYVSLLRADSLMRQPRLYATFLLWLLSELFEELPEVGDLEKPKLVFFFDEAHLLFNEAPKALIEKVEQVVRLIRSKGVGVYFISQSPLDVPESVLGQLGNRIQHALRAFTPRDQKAVRAAAETFRANPAFDVRAAITELAVGEALVSFLDEAGVPGVVQRTRIRPPPAWGPRATTNARPSSGPAPSTGTMNKWSIANPPMSISNHAQTGRPPNVRHHAVQKEGAGPGKPPPMPWSRAWHAASEAVSAGRSSAACWGQSSRGDDASFQRYAVLKITREAA